MCTNVVKYTILKLEKIFGGRVPRLYRLIRSLLINKVDTKLSPTIVELIIETTIRIYMHGRDV